MTELVDVWINCANAEEAEHIAAAAIEARVAACANIFAPITSAFRWHGRVETETEVPLLLHTRAELFDALSELVARNHSYDVPGIIAVPVSHVNPPYRDWLIAETGAPAGQA